MKKIVIIGASSGIGLQLAHQLSENGNMVFGTYFKSPMESISNIEYFPLNIMDEKCDFSFIPDKINGLVYCPGSINLNPFKRISPDEFLEDYKLQFLGAVQTIQAVIPKIDNSVVASIVLFSTVAVQSGFNFHAQVAASKGAIEGLTRSLAAEFAPKIRVNCIAPSLTDTPLAMRLLNSDEKKESNAQRHPLKKIGKPEDIANLAEFLLSEKSAWITGQILHIDGGISTIKN
ncbi:MAG TPA: SDR family oxidoreductase [Draconibacterium sp.]|nr:SDR family oxidoreductase [Draconibacterium sp.]